MLGYDVIIVAGSTSAPRILPGEVPPEGWEPDWSSSSDESEDWPVDSSTPAILLPALSHDDPHLEHKQQQQQQPSEDDVAGTPVNEVTMMMAASKIDEESGKCLSRLHM